MELDAATEQLAHMLAEKGIRAELENGWLVSREPQVSIRASWQAAEILGRLMIEVSPSSGKRISETFVGIGSGEKALSDAMQSFRQSTFEVLLAAFWQVYSHATVNVEKWPINSKEYIAYVGNFGTRCTEGATVEIPGQLLPAIEFVVRSEALVDDVYWFRHFYCDLCGDRTFESLMNNEPWERGENVLTNSRWPTTETYYSIRHFLVLRAVT